MMKRIIIIGGGVSGLSVLHHLKKYYQGIPSEITLFEKNPYVGGTAHTQHSPEYCFEEGPNGFLDSKESTMQLIRELGIESETVAANAQSKIRFLALQNKLVELPSGPLSFLKFPKLSWMDKARVFAEAFVPAGTVKNETVYAFAQRRLGGNFAKYFIDPMVTGVFGGQADQLILRYAFPRMHVLEQTYGSLFKAMISVKKKNLSKEKVAGEPKGTLISLKRGMSQLTETLAEKYSASIKTSMPVISVIAKGQIWQIQTFGGTFDADQVFICTPAFVAGEILREQDAVLSEALNNIPYAPMAVVGCLFKRSDLSQVPKGFGYLIPSSEKKDVLGVLFDSNIFPERTKDDYFLFRLMIGGARRPHAAGKSEKELLYVVQEELRSTLGISAEPVQVTTKIWPKAIPQYDIEYVRNLGTIDTCLPQLANLFLVSNYIGGVSLNDCTQNAKEAVSRSVSKQG